MKEINLTKLENAQMLLPGNIFVDTYTTAKAVSCSLKSIETDNEEKITEIALKRFRLTDIPDAMEKMKNDDGTPWKLGPKIMRKWFSLPPYVMVPILKSGGITEEFHTDKNKKIAIYIEKINKYEPHVMQNLVTMNELVKFPKVKIALDKLKLNTKNGNIKFGFTPKGLEELGNKIGRWQNINNINFEKWEFGDFSKSVYFIDNFFQYNIEPISCDIMNDPIDDFFAAIGTSVLKIAASGEVTILKDKKNKCIFSVKEVAIYLRDNYDFLDSGFRLDSLKVIKLDDTFLRRFASQPLGYWGFEGLLDFKETLKYIAYDCPQTGNKNMYYMVQNYHFHKYRMKHNKGGDFVTYSDLLKIPLPKDQFKFELDIGNHDKRKR